MKTVPLHGQKAAGRVALVDDGDYELVMAYRWRVYERPPKGKRRARGPYAITRLSRTAGEGDLLMHALVTGWPLTDHINHNGLDNQRHNLRPATTAQNLYNQRAMVGAASRFKGVTWHAQTKKWRAAIIVNRKHRSLGLHDSEEAAALAYDAAARTHFGEFACLNFPDAA